MNHRWNRMLVAIPLVGGLVAGSALAGAGELSWDADIDRPLVYSPQVRKPQLQPVTSTMYGWTEDADASEAASPSDTGLGSWTPRCDDGICRPMGCDALGGCDGFGGRSRGLLGLGIAKPSDRAFDDFISPMTNPLFFEDPRTLTEVRFIGLHHRLPSALGGNSVQVYAAQARVALTDRLSFIATKDGLIYTQSPILDSGLADVAAGFKYNLYRDPVSGRLLSTGVTFEIPMGSEKSLQGRGSGELHFFVTGGTRVGQRSHFLSASGLRQALNENQGNSMAYWSTHLDYRLGNRPWYLFTEANWYHWINSGNNFPLSIEGGDIFNFGAPGITGNNIVTQAVGMKMKPRRNIEAGFAFEVPTTDRRGVMSHRWTGDLIIRF